MSEHGIGDDLPPLDPDLASWLAADSAPPMPDEVWERLEARLAAEPPLVPAGVVDLAAERSRRGRRAVLPVLVGAAGVALVGAVVLPSLQSSSPPPVADGVSTGQPALAAGAPAAEATSSVKAPAPAPNSAAAMPRAMVATGTDYTVASLPDQVSTLLSDAGMADSAAVAAVMSASPQQTQMPGVGLASSPEALAECLGRLGLPPESVPLVLDSATVEGRAGSVIVTLGASDSAGQPTALHVVAVGQDCSDDDVTAARHWDLPLR